MIETKHIDDTPVEGLKMVGPEQAMRWRSKWHYAGQRDIRSWHVENLAQMMREGKFLPKTQIAFVRVNGHFYLTNGQHTLAAIELSGIAQLLSVVVSEGATMEDVADDFARRDTHLTRQFSTSLIAHAVHDELGLTRRQLELVTAATIYYSQIIGETGKRAAAQITHDQKLAVVRKHGRLGATAISLFDGGVSRSYLTRRSTLAPVMFCTDKQPDKSEEFFRPMALDDGLRQGDPRKTILEWLRSHGTPGCRSGSHGSGGTKVAADHEFVKAIAVAWNAWIDDRELRVIRINFETPIADFASVGVVTVKTMRSAKTKS